MRIADCGLRNGRNSGLDAIKCGRDLKKSVLVLTTALPFRENF